MNQITTQEFDYSWCRKNSTKVALIDGGRKIQKKATDHAMLTMDLANAHYEQKVRLLDAALEECERSRALAQELIAQKCRDGGHRHLGALTVDQARELFSNEANYSLEDLLNEKAAACLMTFFRKFRLFRNLRL